MSDRVQAFLSNLPMWAKMLASIRLPASVDEQSALEELKCRLANIRRRLRDGPDAPLRLAFFGPTGAGKSKLFGSLIRDNFSGSGFKRPFTRESFYYVHDQWQSLVAALEGEVCLHQVDQWRDIILIDTPDFDSVEQKNRVEAERVFLECDAFLFVTDALKYADASTWEYLTKIHAAGKDFAVILNKVKSAAVSDGFRERFERTLTGGESGEYKEVVVPELRINDDTLIEPGHESMQQLQQVATTLVTGGEANEVAAIELMERECGSFCDVSDALRERIELRQNQVHAAKRALTTRAESAKRHLESRLSAGLEPSVRDDVYQDVLKRLEKIDVLRYPRQLIAMPINGIRSLLSGWFASPEKDAPQPAAFADPISSETFHLLESELISFADQSRNDISARPGLETLIDRNSFKALRFEHLELQKLYADHHDRFANWVARHAEETAAEITTENKAKFVLSQVLFNTVLISSQVALGPGFTVLDLGASGVISPMVAKGVSMAIGNEKVKAFEEAARAEHQQSLAKMVDLAESRFSEFLDQSCRGLSELTDSLIEIGEARTTIPDVVRHFQGSDRESAIANGASPATEETDGSSDSTVTGDAE